MASTFTLPQPSEEPAVTITLPSNLTSHQLLNFKPFQVWLSTIQQSLSQQTRPTHAFHSRTERFTLRSITIQSVDFFGPTRIGFIKMETVVSNDAGDVLPGIVFLRGGSVAILIILRPEDNVNERFVIMTKQPRIPAGSLGFFEIPAGMIDDAGTFAGAAANELHEETELTIPAHELTNLTRMALRDAKGSEDHLQKAMYPSPGGCDEYIALFLWEQIMPRTEINEKRDKLAGIDKEKITVKIVEYEELWKEGARDAKTLAAWALYEGLLREGRLEEREDDSE